MNSSLLSPLPVNLQRLRAEWPKSYSTVLCLTDDSSGARKRLARNAVLKVQVTLCWLDWKAKTLRTYVAESASTSIIDTALELLGQLPRTDSSMLLLSSKYSRPQVFEQAVGLGYTVIGEVSPSDFSNAGPGTALTRVVACKLGEFNVRPLGTVSQGAIGCHAYQLTNSALKDGPKRILLASKRLSPHTCTLGAEVGRRLRTSHLGHSPVLKRAFCFPGGARAVGVPAPPNIAQGRRRYVDTAPDDVELPIAPAICTRPLSVLELFAGAGGMSVGALSAEIGRQIDLVASVELNEICVETLRQNHLCMSKRPKFFGLLPTDIVPLDATSSDTLLNVDRKVVLAGGLDLLLASPPCQGFSSSNRRSRTADNPNNELLRAACSYVRHLRPKVLVLENVQGVLWAKNSSEKQSMVASLKSDLDEAGYDVFMDTLDAAHYGAPQHRSRFFLIAYSRNLTSRVAYRMMPFPMPTHGDGLSRPFVTVSEAFRGLPAIGNGASEQELKLTSKLDGDNPYSRFVRDEHCDTVFDHVTSRHSQYVLERFKRIPPGENWASIKSLMTNYADLERTHSNIYRRLRYDRPSIALGHFRKSMIVHPDQDRGLSLREAARLQTFPDWFRFVGSLTESNRGLGAQQQQLANAVCPLLFKSITEHVARFL